MEEATAILLKVVLFHFIGLGTSHGNTKPISFLVLNAYSELGIRRDIAKKAGNLEKGNISYDIDAYFKAN